MIGCEEGDGVYRPRSAREGGETQSRWLCWHLSCSEICLELCSTCIKTDETFLCQDKNNLRFNPLESLCSSTSTLIITGPYMVWDYSKHAALCFSVYSHQ